MGLFDSFRQAMTSAAAPVVPEEIAGLLGECSRQACAELGLEKAEIYCGGQIVTMLLSPRHAWEALVLGAAAYQFYPGFVRDDGETIVWANVWVSENYSLATFVGALEAEFARAEVEQG